MTSRRASLQLLPLLALVVVALLLPASASAADTARLAHRPSGLTITAPRGYTVTYANGYYTVKGGGSFAVFARGASPLGVKATGAALVKASKGTVQGAAVANANVYRATVKVGRRLYVLKVTKRGAAVDVALLGPGAPPNLRSGRLVQLTRTQLAQVAVLDAIINSRRGGGTALINVAIPMRLAQTADFLASANVPNLPGWTVDGGNGLFAVTHPTQGWGWFGVTIAAVTPAFSFGRPGIDTIITPSADPGVNMTQALPQYLTQTLQIPFQFTQVQLVPGTEGILGPTIPSALYEARFTWRGIPMQGLFMWGTLNQTDQLVNSYFSGVAIADNAPGGLSNALLQTWASANGEAGFRERLSTTLDRLAERPDREFILTPSRFRTDASTWISLLASGAR